MTARYYIAINGPSCALSSIPFSGPPRTIPQCACLIGFATLEEAREAQRLCLAAPIPEVKRRMELWARDLCFVYLVHPDPDPPTREGTVWLPPELLEAIEPA